MLPAFTIFPLGDSALTIDFGNRIDDEINKKVLWLFQKLQRHSLPIKDIIPAYSSLSIFYDAASLHTNDKTAFERVKELLLPLLVEEEEVTTNSRKLKVPVCYAAKFGLDLESLAISKDVAVEELIHWHTSTTYRVYMIGFLPGFAYMGRVNEKLAAPRKTEPRIFVPAGSVGIAGEQTGIYPLNSPGGWNIIGRTPLKIFNAEKPDAVLFHPGDEVSFYSITEDEFENYEGWNL